jgi:hypothetical protein
MLPDPGDKHSTQTRGGASIAWPVVRAAMPDAGNKLQHILGIHHQIREVLVHKHELGCSLGVHL